MKLARSPAFCWSVFFSAALLLAAVLSIGLLDQTATAEGNVSPVADAGPGQTVSVGDMVVLNGAGSSDADGDRIRFLWRLTSVPPGSLAEFSDPTSVKPAFVVDVPGTYVAELVVDDERAESAPDEVTISTDNSPPVADAGADRAAELGDTVQLDGSRSSDFDGDEISFHWALTSAPAGSGAMLSDPAAVQPELFVDTPGTYVAELVVNDGLADSVVADTIVITTENSVPAADAGPDMTARVGQTIHLDGSRSFDANGDPLLFKWSVIARPDNRAPRFRDRTRVRPSLEINAPGTFLVQLVVNDRTTNSAPDTVVITTSNTPPVAEAGPDQTVAAGATVGLDGGGSSDVDGDALTYDWALIVAPPGSAAMLSDFTAVRPSFEADLPGLYLLRLLVNDGTETSAPDTVIIATDNSAPMADAGPDQTVARRDVVGLDGSGSTDPDRDPLTYDWAMIGTPPGSKAALSEPGAAMPTFSTDKPGTYVVQLVVDDGLARSAPDSVVVSTENSRPVADAGADREVNAGEAVTLDGSGSSDADDDALTFRWALLARPEGSTASLSDPVAIDPTIEIDQGGTYVAQLIVGDGLLDSVPDTVVISVGDDAPPSISFVTPADGSTVDTATPTFEIIFDDADSGIDLSTYQTTVNGVDITAGVVLEANRATYTPTAPLPGGANFATASVADNAGNVATVSISFTISSGFRAIADCSPQSGPVPLTVFFRTRGEFPGGSIVRYRWDFEGDGAFNTSSDVPRDLTFTYQQQGTFNALLEVTNNFGEVATDVCTVAVGGAAPTATADAQPSNGPVPLATQFSCTGSDSDGTIVLYEWDFEGDGTFDFSSTTSGTASHTYPDVGTFAAVCRVTDDDALTAEARTTTTTIRPGEPGSPSVLASPSSASGNTPFSVAFNGSATDDGTIVLWEWDFDGDGVIDYSSPTSPAVNHTYDNGGIFAAALRVTDNEGKTSIDTVEVIANAAVALIIPDDTFEPAVGETAIVRTMLTGGLPVRVLIRGGGGTVVRTLADTFRPAGTYDDVWDGTDGAGNPLPEGPYYAVLEYGFGGETRTLDLTNSTGGLRYNPSRNFMPNSFSPFEDDLLDITFTVPPSMGNSEVLAFIGLFNTDTRFITLLERVPFGTGQHTILWDGLDPGGNFAVPPPGDSFLVGIFGFTLPDNAIYVTAAPVISNVTVDPNFLDPSTPDFITPADPTATITFDLSKPATVELQVVNLTTAQTLRRIEQMNVPAGAGHTIAWDGHADDGLFADAGDYRLSLRAIDASGSPSLTRHALMRVFY